MVAIGSATPLPVFPNVKDVGKSGLGTLREKSTWATRQEVDGRPAPEPAAVSALVGHCRKRSGRLRWRTAGCRGRDWGWLCRRQRFVASGKFTDPDAESGDPGL